MTSGWLTRWSTSATTRSRPARSRPPGCPRPPPAWSWTCPPGPGSPTTRPGSTATGPIPAPYARELAAGGALRRLITDPQTGHLLDSSPSSYRPSAALARHVVDRDRVCGHPHCNRPAVTCDLDHTVRWTDGGPTTRANLGPGCGPDHDLRHDGGWQIRRDPDGTAHWTSPAGHAYRKPPWDYRPLE